MSILGEGKGPKFGPKMGLKKSMHINLEILGVYAMQALVS
jgi:hypothetical protein